jgi:hypothetical protein
MSEPTLMNPNPDRSGPASPPDRATTPDRFEPAKIRVVDVEGADGAVERFDCYDPQTEEKIFRLKGDRVQVRALKWARSADMNAEPEVRWIDTGLSAEEVERIRIFGWPQGELIHVYTDLSD